MISCMNEQELWSGDKLIGDFPISQSQRRRLLDFCPKRHFVDCFGNKVFPFERFADERVLNDCEVCWEGKLAEDVVVGDIVCGFELRGGR